MSADKIKTLDLFRIVFGIDIFVIFTKINHHAEELKMFLRFRFYDILKRQKDIEKPKGKKKPKILKESNCGICMEVRIYYFNKIFGNFISSNGKFRLFSD